MVHFLSTLSGTIGTAYTAIEKGIPAIAFCATYSVQTPYFQVNTITVVGLQDPATITARLSASLAQQLITNAKGGRILPLSYGLNVNIPLITSFTNNSCVNPPIIQTRMTGGADVDTAVYNATTGLFTFGNLATNGTNTCSNGDCSLPGETGVLATGCRSAVSVFTVDYDAPLGGSCKTTPDVRYLLQPLVQYVNSTNLVGGFGSNATVAGTGTGSSNATASSRAPKSSNTGPVPVTRDGLKFSVPKLTVAFGLTAAVLL